MTRDEEALYDELKTLGLELHIPVPEAFWKLEVMDRAGNPLQIHQQRSHSWNRNAYNMIMSGLAGIGGNDNTFGGGKMNLKKTDGGITYSAAYTWPLHYWGNNRTTSQENAGRAYRGALSSTWNGIVLGTGAGAEGFEGYALDSLITEGVGAGQFNYAEQAAPVKSYNAGTLTYSVEMVRYMNNNSGGLVGVNEVAIYAYWGIGNYQGIYMACRDKLGATVNIPNTGQVRVTYTVQMAFPA
ncbi:hypothetical protein ACFLV0_01855 [Chloroflexota bacterium]